MSERGKEGVQFSGEREGRIEGGREVSERGREGGE